RTAARRRASAGRHRVGGGLTRGAPRPRRFGVQLVERLARVGRREEEPEQRARHEEAGEDPGERVEAGLRERRDEEAPDAEADADDREHHALGGAAQARREHLPAPELEERLLAEAAADAE